MARITFALTLLFLSFSFTYARTAFDFPENELTDGDPSNSVSASDAKPKLLLSSDTVKVGETEPDTVETTKSFDVENHSKRVEITEDLEVKTDAQTLGLKRPFINVRLRPVNRHSRRGCDHRMKPMMLGPRIQRPDRWFGDDMILGGEKKEFDPEMFRGNRERKEFDREMFRGNGQRKKFDPETFPGNGDRKESHSEMFRGDAGRKEFEPKMFSRDNERKEFDPKMFRGNGVRHIPGKRLKFHHNQHHHEGMPFFPFKHHDHGKFGKQSFRKRFHPDESEEGKKKEEGGFLHEFRKVLDHYF